MHMQKFIYRYYYVLALAFGLCSFLPLHAQLPEDLKITNFDGTTGFYSRVVRSVLKDEKGFLWIGTSDGLYRYDGYTFRNFLKQPNDTNSLAENYVVKLALGKDQKIWMGFDKGGLSSYDPASGKFRNYRINIKGKPVTGAVTMLLVDHNNEIWLGIHQKGLWHLDAETGVYTHYELNNPLDSVALPKDYSQDINTVSAALEGKPGIIWLATHNGLYQFLTVGKQLKLFRNKPLLPKVFRDDDFISIEDDGDILWLGAWAGGLTRYNTVTGEWKNFKINLKEPKKFTTNIISGIRHKSDNELWISSNDKGVGIFDKQKEQFHFYSESATHRLDIPASLCFHIETDKYHNLWLIHEWGLTRIQPRETKFLFTSVPVSKTDNKEFYYLRDRLEDDEHIFIATTLADGLQVINKRTGTSRHIPVGVIKGEEPFLAVYKLMKDSKGNIWVISRDFIYQYDTKKEQLVLTEQPPLHSPDHGSNGFNNIAEDSKGNIWITSSRSGVFKYNPANRRYQRFYHVDTDKNSITSDVLTAITVDRKGRVWVGGPYGCLAYYNAAKGSFQNYTFYTSKNNTDIGNNVTSLLADSKGNIWVGVDAGLTQINGNVAEPVARKLYTSQEGLRGDLAYSIQEDHQGNIWCTTNSSLCMVNPVTQRVNSIVLQNDVMKTIVAKVYLAASGKQMHVLTYGGYYSFDPSLITAKHKDSVITITSFRVKDKEYYYEKELRSKGRIELSATENLFTFEFTVLDFSQSDDRRYAYKLEGFDKNWINAGNRRYASYTNIPAGNYVFKVKALDTYGDINSSIVSIPIKVAGPFYKAWWFILLMASVSLLLLYVVYRFRLDKQSEILKLQTKAQALEKEKTQVQYENLKQHLNPHFLFNSLTSLSSLIRIDQKMAGDFLDGMSKIYRYILQSKDSELVPLKDEIKFIQTFIGLQKTRFADGLQILLNIEEEQDHRKIVPVTLQNLIENAIKHNIIDNDTPLVIELFVADGYLVVRNNMQKKKFVETSNKQGLDNLLSLYKYLSDRPMLIEEDDHYFTVKIPLL